MYGDSIQNGINQRLGIFLPERGECGALGAPGAGKAELGIDLVDVLLHAALGEEELFRDLAVAEPLGGKRCDLALARGQTGKGGRGEPFRSAPMRLARTSPSAMTRRTKSARSPTAQAESVRAR